MFGYPEHIISEPLSPKELEEIIFKNCMPYDPIEAVLQQEVRGGGRPGGKGRRGQGRREEGAGQEVREGAG